MLPTHFEPSPVSRSSSKNAAEMTHTQQSQSSTPNQATPATITNTYPPQNLVDPLVKVASAHNRDSQPSSPLIRRIFGSRGIANLSIDTGPLSSSSSSRPVQFAENGSVNTISAKVKRGRWHTFEFRFYAFVFAIMIPIMVWVPVQLSQTSNPNYPLYSEHLKQGWIFGRMRDDSDFQYRSFRDYLPILFSIMALYLVLFKLFSLVPSPTALNSNYQRLANASNPAPSASMRQNRIPFLVLFTTIFILALHGTNTFKLLLICWVNFMMAKTVGGHKIAPILVWTFNVGSLFAIHWNDGFRYSNLWNGLAFLDEYPGLLSRWQINFNITMLRLVSFSMDYHWARQEAQTGSSHRPNEQQNAREPTPRERCSTSRPLDEYNFLHYILYALYPPLFIAGPIITFNDFLSQLYRPTKISARTVITYAIRFLFCLMTMELILHYVYVNAIKDSKAWDGATPMQLSMIGFWNLIVVWLKLLIPWRFFRLWAMADNVDAPENMVRCMANNYSTLGFWRSWHRSYNLWIVRYIYVPVGGSKSQIPATLLVFTFVALWHDLSLKLLTWGWLVTFFIVPELTCRALLNEKKYGGYWWYRHVCAIGGVGNVLLMMTANLVGFAIGMDGIKYMIKQLLASGSGLEFMIGACGVLFVGVQMMFEYREEELRRGIDRKC